MHDWLRDHGLLIANLALFVIFFGGMILSGVRVYNSGSSESKPVDEQASGRGPPGCGQPSGSAVASPPRRLGLDGLRTLVVGPCSSSCSSAHGARFTCGSGDHQSQSLSQSHIARREPERGLAGRRGVTERARLDIKEAR
jgi:hypothetical protein